MILYDRQCVKYRSTSTTSCSYSYARTARAAATTAHCVVLSVSMCWLHPRLLRTAWLPPAPSSYAPPCFSLLEASALVRLPSQLQQPARRQQRPPAASSKRVWAAGGLS